MFAFTSMCVHVDDSIASNSRGKYSFCAQGAIYHKIDNLLPHTPHSVQHLQLYIYNIDLEIQCKIKLNLSNIVN